MCQTLATFQTNQVQQGRECIAMRVYRNLLHNTMLLVSTLSFGNTGSFANGNTKAHKRKVEINVKYLSLCTLEL